MLDMAQLGAEGLYLVTGDTGAVKDGTLAATVYNDKEGQAAAMANLAFSIATEDENNPNPFKNYKYIYRAYQKVTKENVQTFLEKEE